MRKLKEFGALASFKINKQKTTLTKKTMKIEEQTDFQTIEWYALEVPTPTICIESCSPIRSGEQVGED